MPLDIEELEPTTRNDYRRANGAPMVLIDGKNERYSRPSSFAKPLDDESALVNWKIDRGCIGVAYDRALQAAFVAVELDDRESLKELREKAINAGRGAEKADIGTALHKMSVRWEQGEPGFFPPEPFATSLTAYSECMRRLNLASLRYEFHTVNREYRTAGTADRLYEACSPLIAPSGEILPVGTLIVGDLKTGEKLEFSKPGYAVQCALYAAGEFYDVLTDEFIATPPINQDWAIIVHMPADDPGVCEFLWIDLEIGRWGCYLVQQIKLWRKNWRSGEFPMPPVMLDTNLVRSFDEGLVQSTNLPSVEGEPLDPFPATTCFCGRPDDPAVEHQNNAPCYVLLGAVCSVPDEPVVDPVTTIPPIESVPPGDGLTGHLVREPGKLDRFVDDEPLARGDELHAWIEWLRLRARYIGENPNARQRMIVLWPDDLPAIKHMTNMAQVDRAIPILNVVEADFSLGFVEQPTALQSTGPRQRKGK